MPCFFQISGASREELAQFAKLVQDVGNGTITAPSTTTGISGLGRTSSHPICILDDMLLLPPSENYYVYDSFFLNYSDAGYLARHAVVCPAIAVVDDINDVVYK